MQSLGEVGPGEDGVKHEFKQLQLYIASKVCELRQQPEWWSNGPILLLVSATVLPATLLSSRLHCLTDVPVVHR